MHEAMEAVETGLDLIILKAIDKLIRDELHPAYVDEAPDKIKLITSGKAYLITIKEV